MIDKGVLSRLFNCDHPQSEFGSTLGEVMKHALAMAFFVVILALIGVFGASGKHGVDQAREFVGGGGDGFWFVHARAHAAEVGAQR